MCRRDIRPGFLEDPAALLDEELEAQRNRMEEVRVRAEKKEAKSGKSRDDTRNCDEQAETSESTTKEKAVESASSSTSSEESALDDVRWYYEGRNGWWQYDDRTSGELETFHARGDSKCELLIAGFLYIIDFDQMLQYRRSDPSRRRRILRDRVSAVPRKGIAGIRAFQMGSQTLQPQPPAAQAEQPSGTPSADTLSDNLSRVLSLAIPPSPPPPEATSTENSERLSIRATTRPPAQQPRDPSNQPAMVDRDGND